jgi:hypothetical protein
VCADASLADCVQTPPSALRPVLERARGEANLEAFLSGLREQWDQAQLEFVAVRGQHRAAKALDVLADRLDESLAQLQAMRESPWFPGFASLAAQWEERLVQARATLDGLLRVQRAWLHLAGVFDAPGVRASLPEACVACPATTSHAAADGRRAVQLRQVHGVRRAGHGGDEARRGLAQSARRARVHEPAGFGRGV